MKLRLITNKYFESYIKAISCKRKFEDRFDTLDLNDITTDIDVPSQSEIDSSIRELDLVDNAVINSDAKPVVDPGTGAIELDLDDKKQKKKPGRPSKKLKMKLDDDDTSSIRELDLDDKPTKDVKISDINDDGIRKLEIEPGESNVKQRESNFGNLGHLDIDDVDYSNVYANIEDVYTGLASPDGDIVQGLIKRYAADITDMNRMKEIMLTHAVQCNYESLRAVCGDMTMQLTAKEKELGYIEKSDVNALLRKLRKVARSLTGENNTYGLIPNAIANCDPNNQINCINIIDFLYETLNIPLMPIFYRGAFLKHCYDLADYILDELPDNSIDSELLFGRKGLIKRIENYDDIPNESLVKLIDKTFSNSKAIKNIRSSNIGDLILACINNQKCINRIKKLIDFSSVKGDLIINYLEDSGKLSDEQIEDLKK